MAERSRLAARLLCLVVLPLTACGPGPSGGTTSPQSPIWISRANGHDTAVIFVHGIMGDLRRTFTSGSGVFWPDLLKTDPLVKGADIYTYGFRTTLWEKGLDIKQLAGEMHSALTAHRIVSTHRVPARS